MQAPLGTSLKQKLCHRIPIVCGEMHWSYGIAMGLQSEVNLIITTWYGNIMELVEIHSILISDAAVSTNDMGTFPYQMLVCADDMEI